MKQEKREHVLYKSDSFSKFNKILIHFIVFAILTVLTGKAFFVESDYFLLYIYGVSVTFVLFVNFFIAIFRYEDPAIIAKNLELKAEMREGGVHLLEK